ncbi:hypothetical protein QNK12_14925 [Neobacillus cucumis]|nr:hypothetical protein QNK12_14925 [Neobacillus cucumis]
MGARVEDGITSDGPLSIYNYKPSFLISAGSYNYCTAIVFRKVPAKRIVV